MSLLGRIEMARVGHEPLMIVESAAEQEAFRAMSRAEKLAARQLFVAGNLTSEAKTKARIAAMRKALLSQRGDRQRQRITKRKIKRLERALALRNLLGWPA